MNIGNTIQKIRKEQHPKITQKDLAKKVGLTSTYISQIERGEKNPPYKTLMKIAQILQYSLGSLKLHSLEESDFQGDLEVRKENQYLFHLLRNNLK